MFYFDEAFHTRVITKGYIDDEENCDSYIGVAVGWNASKNESIRSEYQLFEEKYKSFYEVKELKSQIIKKKFYKYGIASFKENQIEFYCKYFSIYERGVYTYVSILSKMETVIRQIIIPSYGYNKEGQSLIYILTKAILLYRPKNVIDALFNESETFFGELKKFIKEKICEIRGLEHKVREFDAFQKCLQINKNIPININFEWYYQISFGGLKLLVKELNLNENRLSLEIDKEGEIGKESKTLNGAKKAGFPKAIEVDSNNELGVRMADLLCGFVGRIIRAMENDLQYKEDDFKNKKFLSREWFKLNKFQFELYKKIAKVFFVLNKHHYSTYTGIYVDEISLFFGLFRYIDCFENYDKYSIIRESEHTEKFNEYVCQMLLKNYQEFGEIDNPNI